jgi:hypothetical protein
MLASIDSALLGTVAGGASVEEQKAIELADTIYTGELTKFCGAVRADARQVHGETRKILMTRAKGCFKGLEKSFDE